MTAQRIFIAALLFLSPAAWVRAELNAPDSAGKQPVASASAFRIVALPDTQYYQGKRASLFSAQTQWIAKNRDALNIKFVVHEGDITDGNQAPQWQNAQNAMRILDGVVPYSVCLGNHDMGTGANPADTRDTTLFNQYFPLSHYSKMSTFGGVYPAEPTRYDNNFHTFNAGGVDWLVLLLEFGPRNEVLTWADGVIASHPKHRVIIVTHDYLYSNETRQSTNEKWDPHSYGVKSQPGGVNDGDEMWRKLVRKYSNISFVINGHVLNDGQGRLVSIGDNGNKVYQMLADYQMLTNGGNGYLRILEFDPANHRVSAASYSPTLGAYLTDSQNQFVYENVNLDPPSGPPTNLLYHNNFEDGLFAGYTVVTEGTIEGPANWRNVNGEIVQSSNVYGPAKTAASGRMGTYAVLDNPAAYNWKNYRLQATMRCGDDDGIGLMFYCQDPKNYYKLDLDRERNFYKLFKKAGGVETTVATAAGQYAKNEDFNVVITVLNGQIRVAVREAEIFGGPISDSSLTRGTFALYDWGSEGAVFDDILVESLDSPSGVGAGNFPAGNSGQNRKP